MPRPGRLAGSDASTLATDRSKGRPRVENPTRRRVLAAGLTGTALGLIGGRAASAGTTPPSDAPTDGLRRPTATSRRHRARRASDRRATSSCSGSPSRSSWRRRTCTRSSLDAGVEDRVDHADARQPPGLRPGHRRASSASTRPAGATTRSSPSWRRRSPTTDAAVAGGHGRTTSSRRWWPRTPTSSACSRASTAPDLIASIITVEAQAAPVLADMAGHGDGLRRPVRQRRRAAAASTESSGG